MNRNVRSIRLRNLFVGPEVWGNNSGALVQRALLTRICDDSIHEIIRFSLDGVKRMDVTFAHQVIIAPLIHCLGSAKAVCCEKIADTDVAENIAAAAARAGVPLTIWDNEVPHIVGLVPKDGLRATLNLALQRPVLRAGELSRLLNISLANASTKLKQLWEAGFLLRDEVIAKSGGTEFVYRRIG